MKQLIASLFAATFIFSPVMSAHASAADQRRPHVVVQKKKIVVQKHRWSKGHRVTAAERRRFSNVSDYRRYRLSAPPRGYRWVRTDNDFLLVGITSGIIASIIAGR